MDESAYSSSSGGGFMETILKLTIFIIVVIAFAINVGIYGMLNTDCLTCATQKKVTNMSFWYSIIVTVATAVVVGGLGYMTFTAKPGDKPPPMGMSIVLVLLLSACTVLGWIAYSDIKKSNDALEEGAGCVAEGNIGALTAFSSPEAFVLYSKAKTITMISAIMSLLALIILMYVFLKSKIYSKIEKKLQSAYGDLAHGDD